MYHNGTSVVITCDIKSFSQPRIHSGDTGTILSRIGELYHIEFGEFTCWVHDRFLQPEPKFIDEKL